MDNLSELLEDQIKDLFSAESQLTKALARMAKKATNPALKNGFTAHLEETKNHAERLSKAASILGFKANGKTCKAMKGLIEEGKEVLEEKGEDSVIDLALIGAARRVEHYEIAAYGAAIEVASTLGQKEVVSLLSKTLKEESSTDAKLSKAASKIIRAAPKDEQEN